MRLAAKLTNDAGCQKSGSTSDPIRKTKIAVAMVKAIVNKRVVFRPKEEDSVDPIFDSSRGNRAFYSEIEQ